MLDPPRLVEGKKERWLVQESRMIGRLKVDWILHTLARKLETTGKENGGLEFLHNQSGRDGRWAENVAEVMGSELGMAVFLD